MDLTGERERRERREKEHNEDREGLGQLGLYTKLRVAVGECYIYLNRAIALRLGVGDYLYRTKPLHVIVRAGIWRIYFRENRTQLFLDIGRASQEVSAEGLRDFVEERTTVLYP